MTGKDITLESGAKPKKRLVFTDTGSLYVLDRVLGTWTDVRDLILSAWVFVGHMTRAKFGLEVSNVEDETKSSEDEGPLVRKAQGLCGPASSSRRVA